MAKITHEPLSLNQGLYTANMLIQDFYGDRNLSFEFVWDEYKAEILELTPLNKPTKWTLIHWWIDFYCDSSEELDNVKKNLSTEDFFIVLKDYLIDTDLVPNIEEPILRKECNSFNPCKEKNCDCCKRLLTWEQYFQENISVINKKIVHATFQIMFSNRRFMHDFNLMVSDIIEDDMDYLIKNYPEYVDIRRGRIIRANYWPSWLKEALLYRDKGTCIICRKNVTGIYNISNDVEIDHIIPLDLFGTNDPTNFQLLCKSCNSSKQARSTETNSINIPFWNL